MAPDSLTGAAVRESTLVGLVKGRGELLTNRVVRGVQGQTDASIPFLTIPGLGTLSTRCWADVSNVFFTNTSGGNVDFWADFRSAGGWGEIIPAGGATAVTQTGGGTNRPGDIATISIGVGNDPGPRRVATLHVFGFQEHPNFPCGFQAQGTLWTSP